MANDQNKYIKQTHICTPIIEALTETRVNIICILFIIHVMRCDLERKVSLYVGVYPRIVDMHTAAMDQLTRGALYPMMRK